MFYSRKTNSSYTIRLASSIDRCYWSRGLALNGDNVKIHVETSYVQDGTTILLTIKERIAGRSGSEREIMRIESSGISNNELILDYNIDLEGEPETEDQIVEPERRELLMYVQIPDYGIDNHEAHSNVLIVDVSPFLLSE